MKSALTLHLSRAFLPKIWSFVYLAVLVLVFGQPALGADAASQDNPLTLDTIETGRKAAEADSSLDETQKQKVLALYDQATQWLRQALQTQTQFTQLETLVREAPQRIEAIRAGKASPLKAMSELTEALSDGALEAIEPALYEEQEALQHARDMRRKQADELARLLVGSKALSEEIANRKKVLDEIDSDLDAPSADESPSIAQARTLVLKTRQMLRKVELEQFKLRLTNLDLLTNLAQAERDHASAEINQRQKRLEILRETTQKLRDDRAREIRDDAELLRARLESLPVPLQTIAEENALYRLELEQLIDQEQAVSDKLQDARLGLDEIQSDFERTQPGILQLVRYRLLLVNQLFQLETI